MEAVGTSSVAAEAPRYWRTGRSKKTLIRTLHRIVQKSGVTKNDSVLVGGGNIDIVLLETVGLSNHTLSNLTSSEISRTDRVGSPLLNAEDLQLPDDSFDVVFAHDVLHHCYTPPTAITGSNACS